MEREKLVYVRCAFLRSAFPHERTFVIRLGDDGEYRGVAPVTYCLTANRLSLGDLPQPGSEQAGLLVGVRIASRDNGMACVYLPDGEVYELPEDKLVVPSKDEDCVHVPIKS
jgi:hypothetical protein